MFGTRVVRLRREWNLQKLRALARYALRRAGEGRLPQVAASLTFTTFLSVVPVLTVAFALLAAFPVFREFRADIETFLFQNLIPGNVSESISRYLGQFSKSARGLTAMGLGGLMLTSVLTMLTVEDALNGIWRVKQRRPLAQRVLVFWAVLTFGPVLIGASLSISSYLISVSAGYVGNMPIGLGLLVSATPVVLSALAFAFLYTAVPNAYVEWRDAIAAGLVAAIAFEFAKRGFGYFVTHIPTYTAVYGTFAALPIFLLWIYLSWLVTLLARPLPRTCRSCGRGTGAAVHSPAASSSMHWACCCCFTSARRSAAQRRRTRSWPEIASRSGLPRRTARQTQGDAPDRQAAAGTRPGALGAAVRSLAGHAADAI